MMSGALETRKDRLWKAYPKYKESGINWLGKIPEHWEAKAIKRLCIVKRGASPRPIDDPIYFDDEGECAWVRIADVSASDRYLNQTEQRLSTLGQSKSVSLCPGDLFVSIAGTVGKPIITKIKCCIHDGFVYFVGLKMNKEFLYYLFTAGEAYKGLGKLGTQLNLNTDTIGSIIIGVPSEKEQAAIVNFLDHETAKIDALISKKEQLIKLLEEKRTAFISNAVTKGLDSNVSTKDSGVEWMGKIPAHWEVKRLKRFALKIQTGSTPPTDKLEYYENEDVPWFTPASFENHLDLAEPAKIISHSAFRDGKARLFPKDTVMIVGIGATIGKVGLLTAGGSCNQQITAIVLNEKVLPSFTGYYLKTLEPVIRGIAPSATLAIMDQGRIAEIDVPLPPIMEQQGIINCLDCETSKIDSLISKIREHIARLQEYRTALISAAVTGKIDVHGEA